MVEYGTRPPTSPDQELYRRLRDMEERLDRLQGHIERGDTWQSWTPVYALVALNQTTATQFAFSYGGFFNQDVLEVSVPMTRATGNHTVTLRTGDALYTITSPSRSTTGTHRLRWLHPYQTHPDDYRFQDGSTTVMRLAPPNLIALDFTGSSTPSYTAWIPHSRASSFDVLSDATAAGTWAYL